MTHREPFAEKRSTAGGSLAKSRSAAIPEAIAQFKDRAEQSVGALADSLRDQVSVYRLLLVMRGHGIVRPYGTVLPNRPGL